jgi:hypothetical protein
MNFMKTNGTQRTLFVIMLMVISQLITLSAQAQPDYAFKKAKLVTAAATDRKVGAKYLFSKVKPGVDCFVTITAIDKVTLSDIDGPDGFDEAFQPVIACPAKTKGYVEFRFDFVITGTVLPMLMLEIPVTAIDIDGYVYPDEKTYEFDEFDYDLVSYLLDFDKIGTSLNVTIGKKTVQAINKTAKDYPGIDTVKRDAMFTMVYAATTGFTMRTGVNNKSKTDVERLRSDYFKKFAFPNSYLAKSALNSFRGNEKNNKVNLQWDLNDDSHLNTVVIEKATSPNQFKSIGEVWVNNDGVAQKNFQYTDNSDLNGQAYYRLKMVAANGVVSYSSILAFRSTTSGGDEFRVYPSVIRSSATVNVKTAKSGAATFQLVDYSGRIVLQQAITVQEGNNNIVVNNMGSLTGGNYVALVKTSDNKIYNQKIFKQ